jgi:hypothetical protein
VIWVGDEGPDVPAVVLSTGEDGPEVLAVML